MSQTQARRNTNNTQSSKTQQPLLAFRILGALPLVNSSYSLAKGVYLKTKENSEFLKTGLDFAESSVLFASAPIVNRYEKLDHYASSKLNQLEDMYENRDKVVDNLAKKSLKTIRRVSYPVGFTLGLASQASNKAIGIASPLIEKAFDYADEVVDNLMPADEPEDAEYLKMTVLQRKNPLRRVKQRTTLISLLNLPSNSINYTAHLTLEAYHTSALLADKFFYNLDRLLKLRSNIQMLSKLSAAPFMLVFPSQRQKLYDFLKGDGFDYVNWSIEETLAKGEKMSEYLKKNGLPNNADLLDSALGGVKQLQGFLTKLVKGQSAIEARKEGAEEKDEEKEKSAPAKSSSSRRHIINPEDRSASFMTGDDATTEEIEQEQQKKADAKEPVFDLPEILFEEKVDEEGFSRARPGQVGHNQKVLPEKAAHAKAPTTASSTHTATGLISNNPFAALLKGKDKHVQEKAFAAHVGRDSLVVMDGTGNVAVAVAHEEPASSELDAINQGETFFTEKDALNGWQSVDNDRRHRRHHHHKHAAKEAQQVEEEKVEEQEEEEEEKPVNIDEHELVVKSADVGLVAIAHSEPLWSDAADGEWQAPKKTFHHTTLQQEEKKVHDQQVHIDAQGNANPYALLQSQ